MTNAEVINKMSNAELFRILATKDKCKYCSFWGKDCNKRTDCAFGIVKWLRSEWDYDEGILR